MDIDKTGVVIQGILAGTDQYIQPTTKKVYNSFTLLVKGSAGAQIVKIGSPVEMIIPHEKMMQLVKVGINISEYNGKIRLDAVSIL